MTLYGPGAHMEKYILTKTEVCHIVICQLRDFSTKKLACPDEKQRPVSIAAPVMQYDGAIEQDDEHACGDCAPP